MCCTRRLVSSLLRASLRRHCNRVRQGTLSCLSALPHDLADSTVARPKMACVPLPGLPFVYSKRAAVTRPSSRVMDDRTFCRRRARLSLTAEARRLTSDTRRGKRAMRWAWQHLVRSSVSRGLRIVPLQVAWRIWRTTAVAQATNAGRRRRRQLYAALHAWQQSAARTKAVLDRPLPLKLASRPTAAACDQARWLLLRRAWAQWTSPCIGSAKAEATSVMLHALNELKVSEVSTNPPLCKPA